MCIRDSDEVIARSALVAKQQHARTRTRREQEQIEVTVLVHVGPEPGLRLVQLRVGLSLIHISEPTRPY